MKILSVFYLKYKHVILPLLSGLAFIVILAFVIIPQLASYLKINNEISQKKHQSSQLEAKAAQLEQINDEQMTNDLKVVFSVLPPSQDVPLSLTILQEIINKSQLSLTSTSFAAPLKEGKEGSFRLNVTVAGQISAIRDLFINLQDAPQMFQVQSIKVQFVKNSNVEAELPITVFYELPSKPGLLDESVSSLNDDEKNLLAQLGRLVPVNFNSPDEGNLSSIPLGKTDPFE